MVMVAGDLPVNDMSDAVVKDCVGKCNSRVVHPRRPIRQDRERQVRALQGLHCDIAQRWRENYIVRDDVVPKHFLERLLIRRLEHRSNRLESLISGHEDGVVGDVEASLVGASQAESDV